MSERFRCVRNGTFVLEGSLFCRKRYISSKRGVGTSLLKADTCVCQNRYVCLPEDIRYECDGGGMCLMEEV